jgi:hypothetical protein
MGVNVILAMTLHPLMIYVIKPKFISRRHGERLSKILENTIASG